MPARSVILEIPSGPVGGDVVLAAALALPPTYRVGLAVRGVDQPGVDEVAAVSEACARLATGANLPELILLSAHEASTAHPDLRVSSTGDPRADAGAVRALTLLTIDEGGNPPGSDLRALRDQMVATRDAERAPDARPVVAVIAQVQSTWGAIEPLVAALRERDDIEIEVVAIPSEHEVREADTASFIHSLGYTPRDLAWFESLLTDHASPLALVLCYDPWDGLRPQIAVATTIAEHGVPIAYVPYGTNVGGGNETESYAYDLPVHRLATRIYARSETQRDMFAEFCLTGSGDVRVLGVPKFDRCRNLPSQPQAVPTVLWNPHFSVEPGGWSTFAFYLDALLSYVQARPDIHLIARPHFRIMRDAEIVGGEYLELVNRLREAATRLPNVELDQSADYLASFSRADAMISDLSSLASEFLTTGKPLLYLHRLDSPGANRDAQYFFECPTALEWPAVERFLDDVRERRDTDAPRRQLLLERHFEHLDGHSAERIAADLVSILPGGAA